MESCSGSHEPSRSRTGYKAVCYRHLLLPGAGNLMRKSVETSLSSCSALSQGLCRCLPAFLMTSVLPPITTAGVPDEQQQDTWERLGGRREPTTDLCLPSRDGSSLWALSPLPPQSCSDPGT